MLWHVMKPNKILSTKRTSPFKTDPNSEPTPPKTKLEHNPYVGLVSDILYQDTQPLENDNILRYYRTEMCPSLSGHG